MPLNHKLKSGDVIEIEVNKNRKGPDPEWLDDVKTHTAKRHIQAYMNKRQKRERKKLLGIKL